MLFSELQTFSGHLLSSRQITRTCWLPLPGLLSSAPANTSGSLSYLGNTGCASLIRDGGSNAMNLSSADCERGSARLQDKTHNKETYMVLSRWVRSGARASWTCGVSIWLCIAGAELCELWRPRGFGSNCFPTFCLSGLG